MVLPKTIVYNDENAPDWLHVIKEDSELDFTLEITIEAWDRIRFNMVNIEGLFVDLNKAVVDAGLTASDVATLAAFLRFTANKITLIMDGTGSDTIEIAFPPGVVVGSVIKADTGESVPFFFNTARNSAVINVTFASEVTLELLVRSIQVTLNNAVSTITTILIVSAVLDIIFKQFGEIITEVKKV